MKATGIVRRVDELGRVVIPREIRRIFRIDEGMPLEMFIEGDMLCFKKYCPMDDEYIKRAEEIVTTLSMELESVRILISTLDKYVAASSNGRGLKGGTLPENVRNLLKDGKPRAVSLQTEEHSIYYTYPIIRDFDVIGGIIILDKMPNKHEISLVRLSANILSLI